MPDHTFFLGRSVLPQKSVMWPSLCSIPPTSALTLSFGGTELASARHTRSLQSGKGRGPVPRPVRGAKMPHPEPDGEQLLCSGPAPSVLGQLRVHPSAGGGRRAAVRGVESGGVTPARRVVSRLCKLWFCVLLRPGGSERGAGRHLSQMSSPRAVS